MENCRIRATSFRIQFLASEKMDNFDPVRDNVLACEKWGMTHMKKAQDIFKVVSSGFYASWDRQNNCDIAQDTFLVYQNMGKLRPHSRYFSACENYGITKTTLRYIFGPGKTWEILGVLWNNMLIETVFGEQSLRVGVFFCRILWVCRG